MFQILKCRLLFIALIIIVYNTISCTPSKKVVYFYDLKDSTVGKLNIPQSDFENPIQKNDQLWIAIGGSNPLDLATLNSANGMTSGVTNSGGGGSALGYLVEADGKIQLPYVGRVQAEGLTRLQLQDTLTEIFKDYTKDPVVNVRFLNYSFSVLGEVNNRGKFSMPSERTTILEGLSMAGDLTEFGMRNNILVVREVNGERTYARVNLLSKDLFKSPYFYLKTNDVVYVEAVKPKFIARTGIPQYLSIAAVALSLVITVIAVSK
jgi:polysaccharide export outer membrane protein